MKIRTFANINNCLPIDCFVKNKFNSNLFCIDNGSIENTNEKYEFIVFKTVYLQFFTLTRAYKNNKIQISWLTIIVFLIN